MESVAKPVDIVIVGAQKAGTTSLFRYLRQHPGITTHEQQEMTYFVNHQEYEKGYDSAFDRYFPNPPANTLLMSKHVMIMHSGAAVARLHQHNPAAFLVMVLRNPVDRAYSAFWYGRRMGWEPASSFESALQFECDQGVDDDAVWFDRRYVENGKYMRHIDRVSDWFEKDRVHIVLHEDVVENPVGVCRMLYERAGLDTGFEPDVTRKHNVAAAPRSRLFARAFAGFLRSPVKRLVRPLIPDKWSYRMRYGLLKMNEKPFDPPAMAQATRKQLIEEYRQDNERLAQYLGRDLDTWNR